MDSGVYKYLYVLCSLVHSLPTRAGFYILISPHYALHLAFSHTIT